MIDDSKIKFRLATASDLLDVQSCAHAAYSSYVERIGREPAPMVADFSRQIGLGQVYIALYNLSFAGYVVFYNKAEYMHLENLAVLPFYKGQGVGKRLIEFVEKTARDKGLIGVELYTNELMTENLLIYTKLGFVVVERKLQAGFNRVFFRKTV